MFYIILKSVACLALFMLFYKLVLEQSSAHQLKRSYLLMALAASLVIPFITFYNYVEPVIIEQPEVLNTITNTIDFSEVDYVAPVDYTNIILWSLYGLGVLIFAIKFTINLTRLLKQIKTNTTLKQADYTSVLIAEKVIPHTFFNYIFFNKTDYTNNQIPQEVLLHEATHAKQKHSLDILFIELLQIVFWFNPLLYFIKKDIRLNHEFLADKGVLNEGINTKNYQYTLLEYSTSTSHNSLANAINYPTLKKRFKIMKTQNSKRSILWRTFLIAPLLALLVFSFSQTETIEKTTKIKEATNTKKTTIQEGISSELMLEYIAFVGKLKQTHKINGKDAKRYIAIYELMSDAQKAKAGKLPSVLEMLKKTLKTVAKKPSQNQLNNWKNAKDFAVWIDGKHIKNNVLNNYKLSDFQHFQSSFVHKNARSKKFPQLHQVSLYTKKGFKSSFNTNEIEKLKNTIRKEDLNPPTLYIKQNPLRLKLNDKATALKNLKNDFDGLGLEKGYSLKLDVLEASINMSLINKLKATLGSSVGKLLLSSAYINDDINSIADKDDSKSLTKEVLPTINDHNIGCNNCKIGVPKTDFEALEINTNSDEKVEGFKIKFPNKKTFTIVGNKLSEAAIDYFRNTKVTDNIKIFDITVNKAILKSTISIKIKLEESTKKEISNNPKLTINGIACENGCKLNFTRKQLEGLILGTSTQKVVTEFKFKVPGFPTLTIDDNKLNKEAINFLNQAKIGDIISLFIIKSDTIKFPPVIITLVSKNSKNINESPIIVKGEKSNIPSPKK